MKRLKQCLRFAFGVLSLFSFSDLLADETVTKAVALISPLQGNSVKGKVTFTAVNGGTQIVADLEGLAPGDHGFHVHQYGDCSAPDGSSVGDHFNPTHKKHGCPNSPEHHVGDMGNIKADQNGRAHYDAINQDIRLDGMNSIIGRSVIVHAGPDDCTSQPAGNSGAKIGCGVIGISK